MTSPLNNLASLYIDHGRYEEAEPFFLRAIAIWEQISPNYPSKAFPFCNLAELHQEQG
jgi:hypothetical protein